MQAAYLRPGLSMEQGRANDPDVVRALQLDLRSLGYLRRGLDGEFGTGTEAAVFALKVDLLLNDGRSTGGDGAAPVAVRDYNRGRVRYANGAFDQGVAGCLADLMADQACPKLPRSSDPAADNRRALAAIANAINQSAPAPFILAMIRQESDGEHFSLPTRGDPDDFICVGLDRNDKQTPQRITSRGYGMGQATLFHHPPRRDEIQQLMLDPVRNVQAMFAELQEKFERFLIGLNDPADDRKAEHPLLPLRLCRYKAGDTQRLRDCRACARSLPQVTIRPGMPLYRGAGETWQPTQYYHSADYSGVPDRAQFPCDWPYAARRYNGGGINSYHYQARILLNVLDVPLPGGGAP